jgi:hypothetical protein
MSIDLAAHDSAKVKASVRQKCSIREPARKIREAKPKRPQRLATPARGPVLATFKMSYTQSTFV